MATSAYTPINVQTAETAVDGSTLLEEGLQDLPGEEPLHGLPNAESLPTPVAGHALMQVTAPATLPGGYEFTVLLGPLHNNRPYQVKVPPGGIEEGQKFTFAPPPLPPPPLTLPSTNKGIKTMNIPVGSWRDGLCNLCNYGPCHPYLWTSCCCPLGKLNSLDSDVAGCCANVWI
jgi:hypothetical protein